MPTVASTALRAECRDLAQREVAKALGELTESYVSAINKHNENNGVRKHLDANARENLREEIEGLARAAAS